MNEIAFDGDSLAYQRPTYLFRHMVGHTTIEYCCWCWLKWSDFVSSLGIYVYIDRCFCCCCCCWWCRCCRSLLLSVSLLNVVLCDKTKTHTKTILLAVRVTHDRSTTIFFPNQSVLYHRRTFQVVWTKEEEKDS